MTALGGPPEAAPELTLELARLSSGPRSADKSRNLQALRSRLGLPAATPPAATREAATAAPNGLGGAANPSGVARRASSALAPWQQWLAVGIVTGTIGFYLGRRFDDPPAALAQPTTSAGVAEAPLVTGSQRQALEPATTGPTPAAGPAAQAAGDRRAASNSRKPNVEQHRNAAKAARAQPAEQRSGDFLQAVQLLARARRALDRGEPALALGLLDELDTRFPREMLDEERGATRVLGLCANGEPPAALELAQRLFAGRPRSIYSRRIEHSCAGAALTSHAEP